MYTLTFICNQCVLADILTNVKSHTQTLGAALHLRAAAAAAAPHSVTFLLFEVAAASHSEQLQGGATVVCLQLPFSVELRDCLS